jgi:hypothetical protein
MRRMRTSLLVAIALLGFGCGDDGNKAVDAPTPAIDAAPTVDAAPPLALDCGTYCSAIKTTCTGANAQYSDDAHCMAMCSKFTPGTQADTSGNTLGCHNWHIQNITVRGNPADTHCSHAGPLGGKIDPTPDVHCGDPCNDFCELEVAVCGVTGAANAKGQYASKDACVTACKGNGTATSGFALTHPYKYDGGVPAGDSLACRMYHLTNAAASDAAATTHCKHTGPAPTQADGACVMGTTPTP